MPTIIYYGKIDLRAQILSAYFVKLNYGVHIAHNLPDLFSTAKETPNPIVVIADDEPVPTLIRLASAVIPDLRRSTPPVFIVYDGEPFDANLPAVTVITGPGKIHALTRHIHTLPPWNSRAPTPEPLSIEPHQRQPSSRQDRGNLDRDWQEINEAELLDHLPTLRTRVRILTLKSRQLRAQAQHSRIKLTRVRDSRLAIHNRSEVLKRRAAQTLETCRALLSDKEQMTSERV